MKIGILGGTGFIGTHLAKFLVEKNHSVVVFTRSKRTSDNKNIEFVQMQEPNSIHLNGFDSLVNLVGEAVIGGRWTDARKNLLTTSRVDYTKKLNSELAKVASKPKSILHGSAIGFYGMYDNSDIQFNETSSSGNDFLAQLCVDWEAESVQSTNLGIRTVLLRTGIVLSPEAGALQQMLTPFKLFTGGPLGSGKQCMSWIHIGDMISGIYFLITNESKKGAFNFTAPNPVTNYSFSKELGSVLNRPSFFVVPEFVIRTLFGESAEVILKGQNVIPKNLIDAGFKFQFPDLNLALRNLLV